MIHRWPRLRQATTKRGLAQPRGYRQAVCHGSYLSLRIIMQTQAHTDRVFQPALLLRSSHQSCLPDGWSPPPAAGAAPAGSAPSLAQLTSRFGCPIFCSAAMLAPWDKTSPRGRVEAPKPVSANPSKLVPRDASRAAFFFPRSSDALDAPHVFVLT